MRTGCNYQYKLRKNSFATISHHILNATNSLNTYKALYMAKERSPLFSGIIEPSTLSNGFEYPTLDYTMKDINVVSFSLQTCKFFHI